MVFVGGHGVFGSRDGGASWTSINRGLAGGYIPALAVTPYFAYEPALFIGMAESAVNPGGGVYGYTFLDDADRDGYMRSGGDCDDWDPTIHPDAAEIPLNGVDENCNGMEDDLRPGRTLQAASPLVVDFTSAAAVNGILYLLGGNIIYVFGGFGTGPASPAIMAFDTVGKTATQVGSLTLPGVWATGAVIGSTPMWSEAPDHHGRRGWTRSRRSTSTRPPRTGS